MDNELNQLEETVENDAVDESLANDESVTDESVIDNERGAIGYIALWLMGVPASVLFLFFLMRGCT